MVKDQKINVLSLTFVILSSSLPGLFSVQYTEALYGCLVYSEYLLHTHLPLGKIFATGEGHSSTKGVFYTETAYQTAKHYCRHGLVVVVVISSISYRTLSKIYQDRTKTEPGACCT